MAVRLRKCTSHKHVISLLLRRNAASLALTPHGRGPLVAVQFHKGWSASTLGGSSITQPGDQLTLSLAIWLRDVSTDILTVGSAETVMLPRADPEPHRARSDNTTSSPSAATDQAF